MVKYSRRYTKKRMLRRTKRSYNISRPRRLTRSPGFKPVSFKRTCFIGNWTPSSASTNGFWRYSAHSVTDIYNFGEYAALFDQYRINAIKVTFRPRYDSFAGNDTTDVTLPNITNQSGCMVHVINDPTNRNTPAGTYSSTTLQQFFENGNVKTYSGNKAFSIYFKPKIDSTISGGFARIKAPWLQTNDTTVVHNGYHVFMQDVNMTGTFGQSFDRYVTFYFQCRGMN